MIAYLFKYLPKVGFTFSNLIKLIWLEGHITYLLSTHEEHFSDLLYFLDDKGIKREDIKRIVMIAAYPILEDMNGKTFIPLEDYNEFMTMFSKDILKMVNPYEYLCIIEVELASGSEFFLDRWTESGDYEQYHLLNLNKELIGERHRREEIEYENGKFVRRIERPITKKYIIECSKREFAAYNFILANNL